MKQESAPIVTPAQAPDAAHHSVRQTRDPVTLSTGRVAIFRRMANGATSADLECGGTMTHEEYTELLPVIAPRPIFAAVGSKARPSAPA